MNNNILGDNIAALRAFGKNGNRITQGELGEALGLSASIISQYEQGTRVPTEENKARIAAYFGVTVDDLYSDKLKQALYTTLTQQGEGNNNIQNNGGIIQATNMVAQLNEYENALEASKQAIAIMEQLVASKNETIAAQQELIKSQAKNLDDLRNMMHLLQGGQP